jgi:hypothetical protein
MQGVLQPAEYLHPPRGKKHVPTSNQHPHIGNYSLFALSDNLSIIHNSCSLIAERAFLPISVETSSVLYLSLPFLLEHLHLPFYLIALMHCGCVSGPNICIYPRTELVTIELSWVYEWIMEKQGPKSPLWSLKNFKLIPDPSFGRKEPCSWPCYRTVRLTSCPENFIAILWPEWTSTHQCTMNWMPIMAQLWINLNLVNIWFHLGNKK